MTKTLQQEVIERGDIYFFYRPKVLQKGKQQHTAQSVEDIQRFYIILHPQNKNQYRLLIMGRKRLPEPKAHEKFWATIDLVTNDHKKLLDALKEHSYQTKTRGERHLPDVRACGEGIYTLVASKRHTYLAYQLELPEAIGEVQAEFHLKDKASYALSVKNQKQVGSQSQRAANFPEKLQKKFRDRRFTAVNPPEFLDYEGAELLFIGASTQPTKELGIKLPTKKENINTAEIFNDLKLWRNEHTVKPLIEGQWA